MRQRNIIVIGTSAGGVEALSRLVRELPSGFPASLFVVCHFPTEGRSVLPEILSRSGPLLACHASDGEAFYPGQIYVAPPDHHLMLGPDDLMRLSRGARENHHRPAIDPLFRSAARYHGDRVIGVVLTGGLSDGTAGLLAIRNAGGIAIVQDPRDAPVAAMPQNAFTIAGADYIATASELVPLLITLVRESAKPNREIKAMDPIERMPDLVDRDMKKQSLNENRGQVSVYTCPECGGALWQVDEPDLLRFRCHVGHAYNAEVLLSEQGEALEAALWTAVRTFREKSVLSRQMAFRERAGGDDATAERYEEQAEQAARSGALIQEYLLKGPDRTEPVPS